MIKMRSHLIESLALIFKRGLLGYVNKRLKNDISQPYLLNPFTTRNLMPFSSSNGFNIIGNLLHYIDTLDPLLLSGSIEPQQRNQLLEAKLILF
jgi:hypothetical protein